MNQSPKSRRGEDHKGRVPVPESPENQQTLPEIPDKNFYKIGEVALITGLEPYVLRYWETEFKEIRPVRARSKQRLYRRDDVDTILKIKRLLHEEKYTIAGAKRKLVEDKKAPEEPAAVAEPEGPPPRGLLAEIRAELIKIKDILS
ncbi:MAG: MerR family transcriptional regulator [Proteobacteria bacterium]|nr:MerR family transcriptional regulator [Pseudomonadota bacterium]MBU1741241.1 MerR family transcriptional regulator [Pseudomonadota bacterium]